VSAESTSAAAGVRLAGALPAAAALAGVEGE